MLTLASITPEHFDIILVFLNENHDWCSTNILCLFSKDNCFESHQNVSYT